MALRAAAPYDAMPRGGTHAATTVWRHTHKSAVCTSVRRRHATCCAGDTDVLATPRDVLALLGALPGGGIVRFANTYPNMSHLDFTWGVHAHEVIYPDVVELLRGGLG